VKNSNTTRSLMWMWYSGRIAK